MKVRWEFYEGNLGTGNYVAAMVKATGEKHEPYVMFVHQLEHCYYASFCGEYNLFKNIKLPYDEVYSNIDVTNLSYMERDLKALKYACNFFEEKFQKQAREIIEYLS